VAPATISADLARRPDRGACPRRALSSDDPRQDRALASDARQMSAFSEAARGLSVGDAMETRFNAIPVGANLAEAIETLLATAQHEFPVVDAFGKPVGPPRARRHPLGLEGSRPRGVNHDFHPHPVETVRSTTPLLAVLDRLHGPQATALAVTDSEGALVGLLTRQNLAEMMIIKAMQPNKSRQACKGGWWPLVHSQRGGRPIRRRIRRRVAVHLA
jgi:CBS domain-containing protein